MITLIILSVLFLAFANGANDNFKGVASLYGSATCDFKTALMWATITTLIGSLVALFLAKGLISTFTGKGLVPDVVISDPIFAASVAFGAALTVMLATVSGLPVSTTHALTGGLVGAGIIASPHGVALSRLGQAFFIPLISSPLIAIVLASLIYPIAKYLRVKCNVTSSTCICIGSEIVEVVKNGQDSLSMPYALTVPSIRIGENEYCRTMYNGNILGVSAKHLLDILHYVSAGLVCFARGLNDTPKIVALLLLFQFISPNLGLIAVAIFMAIGGIVSSKKVANTLSQKITTMNAGQGFVANGVTSVLVVAASYLGFPVSTTHVSCGALFGIGLVSGGANYRTITTILLAWLTTLPLAIFLAAMTNYILMGI